MIVNRIMSIATLMLLFLIIPVNVALAQSTIFNIPTTDTVSKGKGYLEFDYLPRMPKPDGVDRLHIIDARLLAGVGGNIEVGTNIAAYQTASATTAFFQPNIKWKFVNNHNEGLAAA